MPIASDCESDAFIAEKLDAPSVSRSDRELNLAVLKRHDPSIISLKHVSPYAVVYVFNPVSQEWEKSGIEGTAFVCGLGSNVECDQRFSVVVLNRRGLNNFGVEIQNTGEVEVTEEYIIVQLELDGQLQVYGLWVYSEPPPSSTAHHRELMAAIIQECANKAELSRKLLQERDLNGYEAEMEEEAVPAVRQSSSRQNSMPRRAHENGSNFRLEAPNQLQPQVLPTSLFSVSADTDFFRSAQRHGPPLIQQAQVPSPTQAQTALLDLFRSGSKF